ncbi:MAG: glycosyltransferase family 39 protein [Candidatus Melainabacteria bacterium]|nr:glycosyltransferase family 39 protein [Candidatus Melainabacteria bacterium]
MHLKNLFKILNILFIFLLFYIFFSGIGSYGLLAKDEPRYAGCALEMIENHNYTVPKFNFQDRFDKPVLFYWLIAASYKLLRVSAFSSRVPSAICAILLVLFTWYTTKKVLGSTTGFISAIILATSIEYIFLGRRAATDIALCLFFSASLYSMYLGYFIKDWKIKIFWTIASGIFSGLAILTKGPIGIVLLFVILSGFLFFRKQFDVKHIKVYFLICIAALLVSLPWYIMVHLATNGEFTKVFFFTHNLERFTSVVGEHPGPVWFYFPVVLLGFMPWTFFLIPALFQFIKHIRKKSFNRFVLFCMIWAITVFLFFSLCKTKMATYILLLFPPLAIITGHWITITGKKKLNLVKNTVLALLLLLSAGLIVSYLLIPKSNLEPIDKNILLSKILISFVLLLIGITCTMLYGKKLHSLITCFVITLVIPGIVLLNSSMIVYHKITFGDLCSFARLAKEKGAREIISFGGYKPILVYYGRLPVDFDDKQKQIKKIKSLLDEKKYSYIIGYLSDIEKTKPIVEKNQAVFKRFEIIKQGKRYFLGKFS